MFTIKQPSTIIFGQNSARDYDLPKDSLVVTSSGAKTRGWLEYTKLNNAYLFDKVESNPSIDTVEIILNEFKSSNFSNVIGIGGGSSLDVAKFVAFKMKKQKIMIPTTFGSGSEVTRISVLKVNGKKQSFHDDALFADIAIIDSHFIQDSSEEVIKNSAIDACAQCTEGFDSKLGNQYTKFMCKKAFELLEDGILNDKKENIVLGSLYAGLGFGNCSTTLGHALSYVYSNEGYSHGHALAFTTTVAHHFNESIFYNRFLNIVKKLRFEKIILKQNLNEAGELIMTDRKHLDNNPKNVTKADIISLLRAINLLPI
jgi:succinate semialdehyde reductase